MPRHYIDMVSYIRPPTGKKRHTFISGTNKRKTGAEAEVQLSRAQFITKALTGDGDRKLRTTGRPLSRRNRWRGRGRGEGDCSQTGPTLHVEPTTNQTCSLKPP